MQVNCDTMEMNNEEVISSNVVNNLVNSLNSSTFVQPNERNMSKKLEEYDETKLVNNPFSYSLSIPVVKMMDDKKFEFHPPEIEGEDGTWLRASFYAEQMQSTKLYYCPGCKLLIYSLSDKAQRLFLYILYHLQRKRDYMQLNKQDYMAKNNVKSNTTYLAAVDELITAGFIANTQYKTVYWVNPILFSSGDRIAKYPDRLNEKREL